MTLHPVQFFHWVKECQETPQGPWAEVTGYSCGQECCTCPSSLCLACHADSHSSSYSDQLIQCTMVKYSTADERKQEIEELVLMYAMHDSAQEGANTHDGWKNELNHIAQFIKMLGESLWGWAMFCLSCCHGLAVGWLAIQPNWLWHPLHCRIATLDMIHIWHWGIGICMLFLCCFYVRSRGRWASSRGL